MKPNVAISVSAMGGSNNCANIIASGLRIKIKPFIRRKSKTHSKYYKILVYESFCQHTSNQSKIFAGFLSIGRALC